MTGKLLQAYGQFLIRRRRNGSDFSSVISDLVIISVESISLTGGHFWVLNHNFELLRLTLVVFVCQTLHDERDLKKASLSLKNNASHGFNAHFNLDKLKQDKYVIEKVIDFPAVPKLEITNFFSSHLHAAPFQFLQSHRTFSDIRLFWRY